MIAQYRFRIDIRNTIQQQHSRNGKVADNSTILLHRITTDYGQTVTREHPVIDNRYYHTRSESNAMGAAHEAVSGFRFRHHTHRPHAVRVR